jgi:hypothetical protein
MNLIICKNCKKEAKHIAFGYCRKCYRQLILKNRKSICKGCGREMPIHAKGFCITCYGKKFSRHQKEAYQSRKLYGIDFQTYKQKTKKCVICGFNKIVDLHHLDKNHENRSEDNLVGLCPNHHKMIHKSEHRAKVLTELKEKGYKV